MLGSKLESTNVAKSSHERNLWDLIQPNQHGKHGRTSLLQRCLILSLKDWSPQPLQPLSVCGGGILFVDVVDKFKVGMWGSSLGGRVFHCSPVVKTHQKAELEALVRGVHLCINVGWPV